MRNKCETVIDAGSPATAVKKYCKQLGLINTPVKMTSKYIGELLDSGLDNMQIAELTDLIVTLTPCDNPITGQSSWRLL
jgi:hypothetical protein